MESSSNIYRCNLETLSRLEENQTIYYEENRIFIDDRYLGSYRYGNNLIKIIEIIRISFLHYYNQLLLKLETHTPEEKKALQELLKIAVEGVKKLAFNISLNDDDRINYDTLMNDLSDLIKELDLASSSNEENYDEGISDSDDCLNRMINEADKNLNQEGIFLNTLIIIKNKLSKIVLGIGNYIYNMVNF